MSWTDVHDELFKKVNRELDEYARSMWDLPGYAVYGKADEIATMKFCYDQLVGHFDEYPVEDLEYLLRFEQPLFVLRDQWLSGWDDGPSEAFGHLLWELRDKQAAEMDYELDPAWSGPSLC